MLGKLFKTFAKLKMKQKRFLRRSINLWFLCLGLFLFSTGCFLLLNFEMLYNFIINSAMSFSSNSDAFKAWRTNDPPLIMDMYFFNWTNPDEIYASNSKPRFQEVGPYRFKEVKEKVNITFNPNDTVSYSYIKYYYFMEEESPRQLTDVITTINPVALTAAYRNIDSNYLVKRSVSLGLSSLSTLTVTKTMDELLFKGYEDHFLSTVSMVTAVNDRFGWLYKRNGTLFPNIYNMYTKNDEHFGELLTWNYENSTSFYDGECGAIKGSAGEFYPSNQDRDYITLYSGEMCSFTKLNYIEDVVIKGIHAYKYSPHHIFDNGTNIPESECFCKDKCIPSGVLDISACREDSPIFLSLPHFYGADPYYTSIIDGLTPEKSKHEFYITLEPKSAIAVDVAARMQINMLLQPIDHIAMFENVPKVYVPVFYIDQVVPVRDELAPKIVLLQDLPSINEKMAIILTVVGGTFTILAVVLMIYRREVSSEKCDTESRIVNVFEETLPLKVNGTVIIEA